MPGFIKIHFHAYLKRTIQEDNCGIYFYEFELYQIYSIIPENTPIKVIQGIKSIKFPGYLSIYLVIYPRDKYRKIKSYINVSPKPSLAKFHIFDEADF